MTWYNGTYACGHTGTTGVITEHLEEHGKIDKHFNRICGECRLKELNREKENLIRTKETV